MRYALIILLVVFGALMDGFQHDGKKLVASIFKSLFIASIGVLLLFDSNCWHIWLGR